MTPGQRSDYRRRPAIARVRKERPQGAIRLDPNEYAAAFEAAGGTWEDYAAGLTLADLLERRPACPPARRPSPARYVPVPWSLFDSADRYHPCEVQS